MSPQISGSQGEESSQMLLRVVWWILIDLLEVLTASTIQTTTSEKTAIFLRKMFHSVHGLFDDAVSSSNDGMNIEL